MGAAYLRGPEPKKVEECRKNSHPTRKYAVTAARNCMKRDNVGTLALYVYRCPRCRWWHMTSSPQPGQKPIT